MNSFHTRIYDQSMTIALSVGVEESMPRLASRQQHRQNIQAPNSSEYFRLNLTIPLLDHLINEISSRFDNTSSHATTEFLNLLPSTITASQSDSVISKDDFKTIGNFMKMIFHLLYLLMLNLTCGCSIGILKQN